MSKPVLLSVVEMGGYPFWRKRVVIDRDLVNYRVRRAWFATVLANVNRVVRIGCRPEIGGAADLRAIEVENEFAAGRVPGPETV